jgi:glyoxylase-like metal-dependent hydrolase (beta-lactamase superfamily II)
VESLLPAASKSPAFRQFQQLTPHVWIFHDVVNVGVIRANEKALIIDSGEGLVLEAARRAGVGSIEWVLHTHHHRDQCSGAGLLKKEGVKMAVPASEAEFFRRATEFWCEADRMIDHRYEFRPDLFVLRSSVLPDLELQAGQVFHWEGLDILALSTPGHTDGSVTYIIKVDGSTIAFTGDLIYGPGQVWEFYGLQKAFPGAPYPGYIGFGGAVLDVKKSLDTVLQHQPTVLVPSHGVTIKEPAQSVSLLKKNLDAVMTNYMTLAAWRTHWKGPLNPVYDVPIPPPLPLPELPPWLVQLPAPSWYIQAQDGTIFLLDCGMGPVLESIERLKESGSVHGVDGIWISHYHDDHVQSVNDVRRKYGAKLYAQKELQDILENPRAYMMPCLFPENIHVDHLLIDGEVIEWKGYKMTGFYFPGHTLYHAGLLVERDGRRIFFSGDCFEASNLGMDDACTYNRIFLGKEPGYQQSIHLLLKLRPDTLISAHYGALGFSEECLRKTLDLLVEREAQFSRLFPWDNANFGTDPYWVRAYPYRQMILRGQRVELEAKIFNHSDSVREASVELRAAEGWQVEQADPVIIPPHSEGKIRLRALAPKNPLLRRDVLGLVVRFGHQYRGEMAEAIVDYLE